MSDIKASGISQVLLFTLLGFLLTCVLQSSHATLILVLAALAAGQLTLTQSFAIALGSNLGSSFTTALVGMLSSDRNGQRLALAHLIYNWVTALLALILWLPLTFAVGRLPLSLGCTHRCCNWPCSTPYLTYWAFQYFGVFSSRLSKSCTYFCQINHQKTTARWGRSCTPLHLHRNMLKSTDTAIHAVHKEIEHLTTLGLEVVCHAIYVPNAQLYTPSSELPNPARPLQLDVQSLYEWQIKPLYSEILNFTSKIDIHANKVQKKLTDAHINAFHVVEMVKQSKHLQKNMQQFLNTPGTSIYQDYMALRQHLFDMLISFNRVRSLQKQSLDRQQATEIFVQHTDASMSPHHHVLDKLREHKIDKLQASSLINDMNYVRRINSGLSEILINSQDLSLNSVSTTGSATKVIDTPIGVDKSDNA
nr:hypothetical protein [Psychrobacter sp. PraFG1]UNK05312.1 hypothetical protein MN210_15750 [Psychrobacter sp. PraFG1]